MMGSKNHWTPRYLLDRVRVSLYQRRNMDKPWLTDQAITLLGGGLLRRQDVGLEWGSGRSTMWFAQRLKHLTSIEADEKWYQRVKSMLAEKNISNVDYRLSPVPDEEERESDYTRAADEFNDQSLGFVLVDGAARGTCALHALPKIAPGGLLAIDNINWYLDYPTRTPMSRTGKGPRDDVWAAFEKATADWRRILTTTGVTDTAIWVKPS
jgi:predicted O-methyltransferase YrrM